jgi:hypothetical protein
MKLNVMFTIAGLFLMVLGLGTLLGAGATANMRGFTVASGTVMDVRYIGVEMLGLGLIAWLVRNADASKARDAVTLGLTIYFALHALTGLYGQFTDTTMSSHWVVATFQGLFAVGFFMSGKASMSTSAS